MQTHALLRIVHVVGSFNKEFSYLIQGANSGQRRLLKQDYNSKSIRAKRITLNKTQKQKCFNQPSWGEP